MCSSISVLKSKIKFKKNTVASENGQNGGLLIAERLSRGSVHAVEAKRETWRTEKIGEGRGTSLHRSMNYSLMA